MPVPSAGGSKGESASPTFLLRPPLPDPPDPSLIMTPDPSLILTPRPEPHHDPPDPSLILTP